MKKSSLLVIVFFIFLAIASNDTESPDSVSEAKQSINEKIKEFDFEYNTLCKEPRNDQLKLRFSALASSINILLLNYGRSCDALNYNEQQEVTSYVFYKLKENDTLYALSELGIVKCW